MGIMMLASISSILSSEDLGRFGVSGVLCLVY